MFVNILLIRFVLITLKQRLAHCIKLFNVDSLVPDNKLTIRMAFLITLQLSHDKITKL